MAILKWDKPYQIGIREIDYQHQELFNKVNELQDASEEGKDNTKVASILEFISHYLYFHFATEESYMISEKYCGYSAHKEIHDLVKYKVERLSELYKLKPELKVPFEVIDSLSEWVEKHVTKMDSLYAPYIKENKLGEK